MFVISVSSVILQIKSEGGGSCANIVNNSLAENSLYYKSKKDIEQIAQKIYTSLRKADEMRPKIILIEGIPKQGLGIAVMNRLLRTCEYDYLEG